MPTHGGLPSPGWAGWTRLPTPGHRLGLGRLRRPGGGGSGSRGRPCFCARRRRGAVGRRAPSWAPSAVRGGGCAVGRRENVFWGALPLSLCWRGAGVAVTGPGPARNGTGDAARRGPGCAALQLRGGGGTPRGPAPPAPRTLLPTLPALGVRRHGAPRHAAPALQRLPTGGQQVCASAGTSEPWG